ncbi:MAG TPA: hypothetical protein VFK94_02230 [Patescibacteria group bacterium]|nr:hypothetical protein [Patescibacteria group bacterium]
MAHQIGNQLGVVDKRQAPTELQASPATADNIATNANYADESALDTRLAAAVPGTYTAAYLNLMTQNDKVYALRLIDDAGSF